MGIFDEYWNKLTNGGGWADQPANPFVRATSSGPGSGVLSGIRGGGYNTPRPANAGSGSLMPIIAGGSSPAPQTVTREDVAPQVTSNDVSADLRLKNRVRQQAGLNVADFDPMMQQLENQRQQMIDRRNAAIAAAGRGAGAGYSAAISRLDDEISRLQGQMPGVTNLFGQKIQNQYDIYNRAGKELETSYDPALAELDAINKVQNDNLRATFSDAQAGVEEVLGRIGADENTRVAVAQEVGQLQDRILEMDAINAEGTRNIMQAAEKLAVTSAIAAGATNALELKRHQIEVESDMKERLNDLIKDREQQVAARNAAVSAARQLEAARWPEDQPFNKAGFQAVSVETYFAKAGVNDGAARFGAELLQAGVKATDLRKILGNTRNGAPNAVAAQLLQSYGLDPAAWNQLPSNVRSDLSKVATGLEIYERAAQDYDTTFKNADPRNFPLNSAARAMAGQQWFLDQGHSEPDAFFFGREAAETDDEKLRWMERYGS